MQRPFELFSFQHALSTFIIAALALAFSMLYPELQSYWLLLSSFLLAQAGLGAEFSWHAWWQTLAYFLYALFAAVLVFVLSLAAAYFPLMLCILTLSTFMANYLGWLKRSYFFPAFLINVLGIIAAFYPADLQTSSYRCALILLGGLLVFVVRAVFFVYQRSRRSRYAWRIFLQKLNLLYVLILDTTRRADESQFQAAWCDCLAAMEMFKRLSKKHYNLEKIWDLSLSLGSLRYRLQDQTVLSMAEKEFRALSTALTLLLAQGIGGNPAVDFQAFAAAIARLDELYQSMLQTVTQDPLVFLLFIQDLHALQEELETLYQQLPLKAPVVILSETKDLPWKKKIFHFTQDDSGSDCAPDNSGRYLYRRRAMRAAAAVFAALVLSHYFSAAHSFWLVLIASLLTQSELGLPLHQSLQRCLWIMILLLLSAQIMTSFPAWSFPLVLIIVTTLLAYWYAYTSRRYLSLHLPLLALIVMLLAFVVPVSAAMVPQFFDIVMGAVLGILSTLVIFPDKPDREFANRVLPLLENAAAYVAELGALFLKKEVNTPARAILEERWANRDEYFPLWVFEPGYNPALRAGHYYFVVHLGQSTEILFAMHHLARHDFAADIVESFAAPIRAAVTQTQSLFTQLMRLLGGETIVLRKADYIEDVVALEKNFQDTVNLSIELLDLSRDYVYLAAFIRYLKDLRQQLLQLAATLR